ncbi:NADH:ubiquinone oxidoreductase subunit NDUFA12 [Rhodobacteraceae bacterium]|nr:NADH:ubiquinone oxidoreductase subunit NDUFA12 [Paracoccaceae bacterium]
MKTLLQILTWWNGQSFTTRLWTSRHGTKVGEDEQGNIFYQTKDGKRRWVIYNGESQASRVSPDWHGWLHHTFNELPSETPLRHKPWEKPHEENLTGTPAAYAPDGSLRRVHPVERRDYEAWQPE